MNKRTQRLTVATTVVIAIAVVAAAIPQFSHARSASHRRGTPSQIARQKDKMNRVNELVARGREAIKIQNYAAAETAYEELVALDPGEHANYIYQARLYDLQGREQDALEAYGRVVESYEGSSSYQSDPRVIARYGDLIANTGDSRKAMVVYRSAANDLRHSPPSDASMQTLKAAAHVSAGERCLFESDLKGAEKETNIAVASDPTSWEAQYYLGIARAQLGNRQGATVALGAAERMAPAEELRLLRRRRASLGIGENSTTAVIEIKGKKATLKEEPTPGP